MARHRDKENEAAPPELLTFPGWPVYTDAAEWERDFANWERRRQAWLVERGLTAEEVPGFANPDVGDEPWDGAEVLPHGGVWSTRPGGEESGMCCAEHGLPAEKH